MPLDESGSKASVGHNIAAEEAAGKPPKQAIAIALETRRRALRRAAKDKAIRGMGPYKGGK